MLADITVVPEGFNLVLLVLGAGLAIGAIVANWPNKITILLGSAILAAIAAVTFTF